MNTLRSFLFDPKDSFKLENTEKTFDFLETSFYSDSDKVLISFKIWSAVSLKDSSAFSSSSSAFFSSFSACSSSLSASSSSFLASFFFPSASQLKTKWAEWSRSFQYSLPFLILLSFFSLMKRKMILLIFYYVIYPQACQYICVKFQYSSSVLSK